MRSLLGDRFLRRFAGNLKHRGNHRTSKVNGQNPDGEPDMESGSNGQVPKEDVKDEELTAKNISDDEEQNR